VGLEVVVAREDGGHLSFKIGGAGETGQKALGGEVRAEADNGEAMLPGKAGIGEGEELGFHGGGAEIGDNPRTHSNGIGKKKDMMRITVSY